MIYGFYSTDQINKRIREKAHALEQLMNPGENKIQKFNSFNFEGGYVVPSIQTKPENDFFYEDKTTESKVIFSGNIYNQEQILSYFNLTDQFISLSHLIYTLYKSEGPKFVNLLNGDFTFAIIDSELKSIFLFRDHLGIYPLVYTFQENTLCYSSDNISLCRVFYSAETFNREILLNNFKMVNFSQLLNSDVKKLLPGHYLKFTGEKLTIHKYWYPEKVKINKSLSRDKMLTDMKFLIEKAVKIRCDDQLNASSHLSGGLDSGIVAALARKVYMHQTDFYGFSWSPDGNASDKIDFDERELVLEQSNLNNIKPLFVSITNEELLKFISEPLNYSSSFQENKVLIEAHKKKIDLIFSGYGGDEFVSIGSRGIETDLFLKFHWNSFFKIYPVSHLKLLLRTLLYEIFMPFLGVLPYPVRKDLRLSTTYLKSKFNKPHKKTFRKFYFFKSRRHLHLGYLYRYHLPDRIESWFINGWKYGIQYRYPLLDKEIIEYMLSVHSKFLFKDFYYRSIIREISEGILPESVRWKSSGRDPVAHFFCKKVVIESSQLFINDLQDIRKNPELDLIDFKKLDLDLEKFHKTPDNKLYENLLYSVFYIKQIHEFIKAYKNFT